VVRPASLAGWFGCEFSVAEKRTAVAPPGVSSSHGVRKVPLVIQTGERHVGDDEIVGDGVLGSRGCSTCCAVADQIASVQSGVKCNQLSAEKIAGSGK
jgi:hypothetical protein